MSLLNRDEDGKSSADGGPSSASPEIPDNPELLRRLEGYSDSLKRGDRVDREELLAEFPEAADQLAAYLDAMELVEATYQKAQATGPEAAEQNSAASGPVGRTLGDYRILAEIGRGGMGVVYEAEQVSLKRRVALKIFPTAPFLAPKTAGTVPQRSPGRREPGPSAHRAGLRGGQRAGRALTTPCSTCAARTWPR